jgi:hypothetical protein
VRAWEKYPLPSPHPTSQPVHLFVDTYPGERLGVGKHKEAIPAYLSHFKPILDPLKCIVGGVHTILQQQTRTGNNYIRAQSSSGWLAS